MINTKNRDMRTKIRTHIEFDKKEERWQRQRRNLQLKISIIYYGAFHALKDINMKIPAKNITAFIRAVGLRQIDTSKDAQSHE